VLDTDAALTAAIEASSGSEPVETTLKTDDRVLARITDGIYRQPGSAIRELISNAYDADATRVVIKTDRPRFERVTIEDNGQGMSAATLARLIRHIGGSAKRSVQGAELGITSAADPLFSPGGRRLIGRIGIGLFSVAQLTHRFQIITKTAGDSFRTVATVALRQYAEDVALEADTEGEYEAGLVNIWREPAADEATHGTTIVLTDIKHQTRDTLQSRDLWAAIDADDALAPEESRNLEPPDYHIGRVDRDNSNVLRQTQARYDSVPWSEDDSPAEAFARLVGAVWDEVDGGVPNPKLDQIFDYYLRMVWQLSLAVPCAYVAGHPFDIAFNRSIQAYQLPRSASGTTTPVTLTGEQTLRKSLDLHPVTTEASDFEVLIDDLRLMRPLLFTNLPTTSNAVKTPMLFVGRCREEFPGVPRELSGGPLEFQAYLLWAPKIAPTEHQGVLIRIHGSSGTLFDPSFLRYQVSEQTRLRQITCEVFVTTGLEGALNIDRESFNYAHPHVVFLTKWLHLALRRVATTQKKVAADIRSSAREEASEQAEEHLDSIVANTWREATGDEGQRPPPVTFDPGEGDGTTKGGYRYRRSAVFGTRSRRSPTDKHGRTVERKLRAILQILAAYEFLDNLPDAEQERLASRIREVLEAEEA